MAQRLRAIEEDRADDSFEDMPALSNESEATQPLLSRQRTIRQLPGYDSHNEAGGDDWWCTVVFVLLLLSAAVRLIFWVYASETLHLGPNSSILLKPNHLFVDFVKVVELGEAKGSMLYGFYKEPPLDVLVSWSEIHKTSLPISTHKEWMYYLNEGSQMNISYSLNSSRSSSLVFVIAQGKEEFANWLEDPSYSSANLSRKIIQGNGTIQKAVLESSAYYVAVRNVNAESVEVLLNIRIKAFLFNTTEPYYKCMPAQGQCNFKLYFLGGNVAVLTRPGRQLGIIDGGSNVKISYGHRWITYYVGIGGISAPVLVINIFLNHIQHGEHETIGDLIVGLESERNPLLLNRDDDAQAEGAGNVRDPCTLCRDAPSEGVSNPCRHVACSKCATRLPKVFGKCRTCRQPTSEETTQSLSR